MVQPAPSSPKSPDELLAAALRDPHAPDLYEAALRAYLGLLAASPSDFDVQYWDQAFAELLSKRLALRLTKSKTGLRKAADGGAGVAKPVNLPLGKIERGELLSETIIRERR
ncbi:MAG: hypothetical protein FLDDKLPJ_01546 [Phycisphaerae bacterium]|nr:hypothetical protein [Phycisphaerae bacterium]